MGRQASKLQAKLSLRNNYIVSFTLFTFETDGLFVLEINSDILFVGFGSFQYAPYGAADRLILAALLVI